MPEPAYRQVAATLRREIQDGTWSPGDRLPTLPELQERFGVSRITARGAIEELVRENLVYTAGSRGTLVRSAEVLDHVVTAPLRADRPRSAHDVFMETATTAGRTGGKEFSMAIEPAPADMALRLGIPTGEFVVRRSVVQWLDGEPWSWEVSYYPAELAREVEIDVSHDIPEGTTRRLADRGYREIGWVDETMTRPASPDEAHVLGVATGTDLHHLVRTGATAERVTRTTRTRLIADRNRVIHELGSAEGIEAVYAARGASA